MKNTPNHQSKQLCTHAHFPTSTKPKKNEILNPITILLFCVCSHPEITTRIQPLLIASQKIDKEKHPL